MKTCSTHIKIYEIFNKKFIDGFPNSSIRICFLLISFSLLPLSPIPAQNEWRLLGLEDLTVEYVYANSDTIWVSGFDSTRARSIYYSFNGGNDWTKVNDTDTLINGSIVLLSVSPHDILTLYAVADKGRGIISTDGGISWQKLMPFLEPWPNGVWIKKIEVSPHNRNIIFGIMTDGFLEKIIRTTDGGNTWDDLGSIGSSSHGNQLTFALDPIDSNKIYAAVYDNMTNSAFLSSNDLGETWYLRSSDVFSNSLIVDWSDNNKIYLTNLRSDDGGYTWERIMKGIIKPGLPYQPWVTSVSIDPLNPSVLYALFNKVDSLTQTPKTLGIYKTTDRGNLWSLMEGSDTLELFFSSGNYLKNLFIDPSTNKLYIGTNKGLYKYDLIVFVKNGNKNIPKDFVLYQNYPNPFNPTTVISYQLPAEGFVKLIIYDQLGREITTLVNKAQNAGSYKINFDGSSLTSGIYFYKLTWGSFSSTRKMLLLK